MLANWSRVVPLILQTEGGFVNDPQDPGGATNLGVTIGTAKALGLDINHDGKVDTIDIKLLRPADAAKVYKRFYWDALQGDLLPLGLDYATCDFGVNSGVSRAAQFLQQIVGAGTDGHIGPATMGLIEKANVKATINALCDHRLAFLQSLPTWGRFGPGWGARVTRVKATALAMAA